MSRGTVFGLCGLALLAGCCSNVSTDPRAGGLAGGVCGEATGAYRQRVAARENVLASLDRDSAALAGDLAQTRRESAGLERRIAALRRQSANDRSALRDLEARIAAARRDGRLGEGRRRELEGEIARLDGEFADLIERSSRRERALRALGAGASGGEDVANGIQSDEQRREARLRELQTLSRSVTASAEAR